VQEQDQRARTDLSDVQSDSVGADRSMRPGPFDEDDGFVGSAFGSVQVRFRFAKRFVDASETAPAAAGIRRTLNPATNASISAPSR